MLRSAGMLALIREGVAHAVGRTDPAADKTALLTALLDAKGAAAVVELGLGMHRLLDNPVLATLTGAESATGVLQRWLRLERFGHTRNRTRIESSAEERATLVHVAIDGGTIDPVNDLFVWGLLVALLERAGYADVAGALPSGPADAIALYADGAVPLAALPSTTHRLQLAWGARQDRGAPEAVPADAAVGEGAATGSLARLFRTDLARGWKLSGCAKVLGLSTRQLQRQLKAGGTTFTETLQHTRLDAAGALLQAGDLNLTEIAFCTGFADLAHFSRLFRRRRDLPPSAVRELLRYDRSAL